MPDYMSLFGSLQCHCLKCYSVTVSSAMMSLFEALQRHCFECYDVTVSPILSENKVTIFSRITKGKITQVTFTKRS